MQRLTNYLPPRTLCFLLLWAFFLLVGRTRFFQDPGTFWHTLLGEQIIATGQIPEMDSFTFTRSGTRWLTLQWLAEIGMAVAYRWSGFEGQLLLLSTLLAGFFTWLFARALRQGLHWLPAAVVLVLVLGGCAHHLHVRPHIASILLLAWTLGLLCDVEARRRSSASLWWLLPVFMVWTNLHGGVLGGWLTVACWLGLNWLHTQTQKTNRDSARSPARWWLAFPLLLAACFLVNPYGLEMPIRWVTIMTLPLENIIDEHGPTDFTRPEGIMFLAMLALYLVVLIDALRHKRRRVAWLLPLIWAMLAITRVRHVPLFSVAAAVAMFDMLPYTQFAKRLAETESFFPDLVDRPLPASQTRATWIVSSLMVAMAIMAQGLQSTIPIIGSNWVRLPDDRWPIETARALVQIAPEDREARLFNDLSYGGYLAMHHPRWKLLVDDRCELFGGQFLQEYRNLESNPERLEQWSRAFGFTAALIRQGTALDRYLEHSDAWKTVSRAGDSALFVQVPDP